MFCPEDEAVPAPESEGQNMTQDFNDRSQS